MATKNEQVYKCQVCTNEVKVVAEGIGTLVCCAKPMELKPKE
jgi:superoxide reductase